MRRDAPLAALTCMSALVACGSAPETSAGPATGLRVEAQQHVLVTDEPLGDVVSHELQPGDRVTAVCFAGAAQTNTGAEGSAIEIEAGRRSGYAATTDFPEEPSDRSMIFDVTEDRLRERLPACDDHRPAPSAASRRPG